MPPGGLAAGVHACARAACGAPMRAAQGSMSASEEQPHARMHEIGQRWRGTKLITSPTDLDCLTGNEPRKERIASLIADA